MASDPEGFVDVSILCTFSRMQALLGIQIAEGATVSDETINDVADAVQASETLVLSEDKRRVRRLHVSCCLSDEIHTNLCMTALTSL